MGLLSVARTLFLLTILEKNRPLSQEMTDSTITASLPAYDLIVIGGGVVGLACLRAATLKGWKCALVEAQPDLLTQASGGNSGIVCTGVDALPGTLERALIRDSISEFRLYCESHNIPIRPCGSLVCLFPWDVSCENADKDYVSQLNNVLQESHIAGDSDAKILHSDSKLLTTMENNVSSRLLGAVHIPGEMVVDSWVYSISLAAHAVENGAKIYTNFHVECVTRNEESDNGADEQVWVLKRRDDDDSSDVPLLLQSKAVVNATGSWSDLVEGMAGLKSQWTTKPRRGQYRVYNSNAKTRILHPLQPIPNQKTKGVFVFSTLHNQLVVGPTALDQTSRTDRSIDPIVAQQLDDHIKRVIPHMDTESSHVGDFVGIRPGTEYRDYQIHLNPKKNWIAVAGIRSTGLTASLGIGNYVVRLLRAILKEPSSDVSGDVQTTKIPTLEQLAVDYLTHGDGCCAINGLGRCLVTHPLTRMGFEASAARAASVVKIK